MLNSIGASSEEIQAIVSFITAVALIPAAIVFFINQENERKKKKDEKHSYIISEYRKFLEICLDHAKFDLPAGPGPISNDLSKQEIVQRDIMFEIMLSLAEEAFLVYADSKNSYRLEQWAGWDAYIRRYSARKDYQEWWHRIILDGESKNATKENLTEHDRRYEAYVKSIMEQYMEYFQSLDK